MWRVVEGVVAGRQAKVKPCEMTLYADFGASMARDMLDYANESL